MYQIIEQIILFANEAFKGYTTCNNTVGTMCLCVTLMSTFTSNYFKLFMVPWINFYLFIFFLLFFFF